MYNDIDDIPIPFYKRDNIYIIVGYLLWSSIPIAFQYQSIIRQYLL